MAKISGIKGINISKSSVLKDGSKKSGANDSFRDTANGTTRDNSKNNNKSTLDAAMIKMLLGQTELMAKKTAEIEANMKVAAQKENDRQRREAEYWRKVLENEEKKKENEKKKNDAKYDAAYQKVDNGIINSFASGIFGPAGVMLGKGINAMGIPLDKWGGRGIRAGGRLIKKGLETVFGDRRRKHTGEDAEQNEGALGVNRREMAAEPINKFNEAVTTRLDRIIELLGGGRSTKEKEGGKKDGEKGWLSNLLDKFLPKGWLGKLLSWLGPKLGYLALLGGLAYGFHRFWNWIKDKFGVDWANGLTSGLAQAVKGALKGVGSSLEKAANSLKSLKQGFTKAKVWGAASKGLNKLANSGKVGKFLFGNAAKRARAASIAAQRTLQSGQLGKVGKFMAGAGKTLSKVGKAAGVVGNVVIAGESMYDAYTKYKQGDKRGAAGSLGKGAGTLAGGALGAKGGAALGATIGTMIFPGIGTAVGGFLGGIAGAIGGGWLGSKLGGKAAEKTYDVVTGTKPEEEAPEVQTEGEYSTEDPAYASLQLQSEAAETQNEILNTLRQIEWNLKPEVQQSLDEKYLNNAQRMFDVPPEVTQQNLTINGGISSASNPLGLHV